MREYNVHFSFYSEEYGNFDDVRYPVMADNPFEAREKAWQMCDEDSDALFRSNIRQFAVTWTPNMLDAGDYFYSHAADIKRSLGCILNVAMLDTFREHKAELLPPPRDYGVNNPQPHDENEDDMER